VRVLRYDATFPSVKSEHFVSDSDLEGTHQTPGNVHAQVHQSL
jgi:hypothetical protein